MAGYASPVGRIGRGPEATPPPRSQVLIAAAQLACHRRRLRSAPVPGRSPPRRQSRRTPRPRAPPTRRIHVRRRVERQFRLSGQVAALARHHRDLRPPRHVPRRCAHLARGAPRHDVRHGRRVHPGAAAGWTSPRRFFGLRQGARRCGRHGVVRVWKGAGLRHGQSCSETGLAVSIYSDSGRVQPGRGVSVAEVIVWSCAPQNRSQQLLINH